MMYAVHSLARGRMNRTQRAAAPIHASFKQYIGADQRRLVRNRPVEYTEAMLLRDMPELQQKVDQGLLEVRTSDGRLFDLKTLQAAPIPAPPPLKVVMLDSVSRDLQDVGQPMPQFPGGVAQENIPQEFQPDFMEVPAPTSEMSFQEAEELTRKTGKQRRR